MYLASSVKQQRPHYILIVEEHTESQENLAQSFREKGIRSFTCANTQEAVRFLKLGLNVDAVMSNIAHLKEDNFVLLRTLSNQDSKVLFFIMSPSSQFSDEQVDDFCQRILRSVPSSVDSF